MIAWNLFVNYLLMLKFSQIVCEIIESNEYDELISGNDEIAWQTDIRNNQTTHGESGTHYDSSTHSKKQIDNSNGTNDNLQPMHQRTSTESTTPSDIEIYEDAISYEQNNEDDDYDSDEGDSMQQSPKTLQEVNYAHDIFMRYFGPHSVSFGHVEHRPGEYVEKRLESLDKGHRYKGKIIWADHKTGGYGEHYWDMAQGKL